MWALVLDARHPKNFAHLTQNPRLLVLHVCLLACACEVQLCVFAPPFHPLTKGPGQVRQKAAC